MKGSEEVWTGQVRLRLGSLDGCLSENGSPQGVLLLPCRTLTASSAKYNQFSTACRCPKNLTMTDLLMVCDA